MSPTPLSRPRRRALSAWILGASLVLAAPISAHGASYVATTGSGDHPIVGKVVATGPVRGARVSLLRMDGRAITNRSATTDRNGTFYIAVDHLPRSFRVRVDGGRDFKGRILGKMYSTQHGRTDHAPVLVNPATTMVAVYRMVHPRVSIPAAELRVARYLGLPKGLSLDVGLHLTDRQFSDAVYMQRAKRHPARYARALVPSIHARKVQRFIAPPPSPRRAAGTPAATGSTSRSTARFSLEPKQTIQMTSQLAGALSTIELAGEKIPGGAAIAPIFATVLPLLMGVDMTDPTVLELQQINARLDQIEAQLSVITGQLYENRGIIESGAYANSVDDFAELRGAVDGAWINYTTAVESRIEHGATSPEFLHAQEAFLADYRSSGNAAIMTRGLGTLASKLNTTSGVAGANPLQLWNRAYADTHRFITREDQERMASAYEYWRDLHARLLVMNVEYATTSKYERPIYQDANTLPYRTWVEQYARTPEGDEAPRLDQWRTNAGLDVMTDLVWEAEDWSQVYDSATGLMWANNGRQADVSWSSAQVQVSLYDLDRNNNADRYRLPQIVQFDSLFAAQGAVPGRDAAKTEQQHLVEIGFGRWVTEKTSFWAAWNPDELVNADGSSFNGYPARQLSPGDTAWRGYRTQPMGNDALGTPHTAARLGVRPLRAGEHPLPF